jgi:predicted negative regulator of RcsB-dependent stress response
MMAAYDLEEQEQIDNLKAFWAKYGNALTWVLTAVLAAAAAFFGWQTYTAKQAVAAGEYYEAQERAIKANNLAAVKDSTGKILESYGSTVYGQMAALRAAKFLMENKDPASGKAQLQWVADKGRDESYRIVARVRLAGVLLDEKAYDEALKLLTPPSIDKFAPLVLDRKGDVLVAQGKTEEAKAAFLEAYKKLTDRDVLRTVVQAKLEFLGGAVPETPAEPAKQS